MTQPAQQPQTAPPAAPAAPVQGQPAQQPPSQPLAPPAQPHQPAQAWPAYMPPAAPQQQQSTAPPGWPQQQPAPGQPPHQQAQPAQQPYPAQPYPATGQQGQPYPMLPAAYPPPPAPADGGDDGQGGYDLARLPKAAREEIERLRTQAQQHTVQLRTAAVSQQAWALAPQLGVNPQALVGSLAWQQAAAQLDPNAPDYAQRLPWTIQGVLAANPWMAAAVAPQGQGQQGQQSGQGAPQPPAGPPQPPPAGPARSGGDFTGGPAGGAQQHIGTGVDRLRHAYSQQT